MKAQKLIPLFLLIFCIGSCQNTDNIATQITTPSAVLSNNFKQIFSYWGRPILSSYDGTGKPKLYFSVITQPDELKNILSKVDYPEKIQSLDLTKDILLIVDWGMYFSGGVKVEVKEVRITNNQAEVIVETILPDPKIAQAAAFSSALDFVTISRQNFDTQKTAKFVLINNGIVISTISVDFH
jgi:hypothetical protein